MNDSRSTGAGNAKGQIPSSDSVRPGSKNAMKEYAIQISTRAGNPVGFYKPGFYGVREAQANRYANRKEAEGRVEELQRLYPFFTFEVVQVQALVRV